MVSLFKINLTQIYLLIIYDFILTVYVVCCCQNLINELRNKEKQLEKKQEVLQLYKNGLKGVEDKKVRTADINPILAA